jgi:methionyl-tRNA synthetase
VLCNTYYGYSVYCGALHDPGAGNAFDRDSGVTTLAFFGIDNTVAGVAAPLCFAHAQRRYRGFDRVVTNCFLSLEGSKFSTSRGHAIWVADVTGAVGITADELRSHLFAIAPETAPADFRVTEFVAGVNVLRTAVRRRVAPALATAPAAPNDDPPGAPGELMVELERLLERQARALAPESPVRVRDAAAAVRTWLELPADLSAPRVAYWWLRGLAVLAEPVLPGLAGQLWGAVGEQGRPTLAGLATPSRGRPGAVVASRDDLDERALRPYVHLATAMEPAPGARQP